FRNIIAKSSAECFTCMSNPNWDFYASRIEGLKSLTPAQQPTLAPISCIFTPLRVYSDRTAVACPGKCLKWIVNTIRADGGVEASILRGCFEKLVDVSVHAPPKDNRCYQSPADYNHQVDVDYTTACFCTGFLCNSSAILASWLAILLVFTRFF
ncbi:hypothetical protein PMAYCL1PPCAC_26829, partial [Pristionchus mayeri]